MWICRFLSFLVMIHATSAFARDSDSSKVKIMGEFGIGAGTHTSFRISVNSLFGKNNILGLMLSMGVRDGRSVPRGYYSGSIIKIGDGIPNEKVFTIGVLYGKIIYSLSYTARFSLKGGLAYFAASVPGNFTPANNTFFGPNYHYRQTITTGPALIFNPSVEFPFARGFGMGLGLLSIVNKVSSSVGIEAVFLFF